MSALRTRHLHKAEMRRHGWQRMYTRPKDQEEVVVAQEWIDRKYGTTDQFLTSMATYCAAKDEFEICADAMIVKRLPANRFHWWMKVYSPVGVWTHHLTAADWWRRGMGGEFLVN